MRYGRILHVITSSQFTNICSQSGAWYGEDQGFENVTSRVPGKRSIYHISYLRFDLRSPCFYSLGWRNFLGRRQLVTIRVHTCWWGGRTIDGLRWSHDSGDCGSLAIKRLHCIHSIHFAPSNLFFSARANRNGHQHGASTSRANHVRGAFV